MSGCSRPAPYVTKTVSRRILVEEYAGPVLAFRRLSDGTVFVLDELTSEGGSPRKVIAVGADPGADIHLSGDKTVSRIHCLIFREDSDVLVGSVSAKNGTFVNGVGVGRGQRVQVFPGSVLVLGETLLVACNNAEGRQPPEIVATDLDTYLRKAEHVHGSARTAARFLGIPAATLSRWLRLGRWK